MKRILVATALSFVFAGSAHAAIEIDESQGFGPTYGSTMADVTIGKPLQVVGAVLGTVAHVVNLPFAMASDSVDESYETLVAGPWSALQRCSGCSPAYDNYVKSQQNPQGEVRFIVTQPSEVIIHSNDTVIVAP
ncbi:MAG: hypothetical protein Q4C68_01495 [Moraxella sp.]|nr:hypothetical protein [Moraxella sp.]